MADWIRKDDVKFNDLYKKMPDIYNQYLLILGVNNDKNIFLDRYEINIQDHEFQKELLKLKEGNKDRCYFAFGMQDIDFYKSKEGKFGITHSPYSGLNVQLILVDGEFERILECFGQV